MDGAPSLVYTLPGFRVVAGHCLPSLITRMVCTPALPGVEEAQLFELAGDDESECQATQELQAHGFVEGARVSTGKRHFIWIQRAFCVFVVKLVGASGASSYTVPQPL